VLFLAAELQSNKDSSPNGRDNFSYIIAVRFTHSYFIG